MSYKLKTTSSEFKISSCEFKIHELRVQVQSHEVEVKVQVGEKTRDESASLKLKSQDKTAR